MLRRCIRLGLSLPLVLTLLQGRITSAQSGPDIPTWQFDTKHTGVNPSETTLNPSFVSTPGNVILLYTEKVDGQVFAQPLFLSAASSAKLPGGWADGKQHNDVVFVLTENATLYAFDGDQEPNYKANTGFSNPIWSLHLVPPGNTTAVAQPRLDTDAAGDIDPLFGATATPVIDVTNGVIYVVSSLKDTGTLPASHPYEQLLWALNVKTGQPVNGSPVTLNPQFNGVFAGDNNPACTSSNYTPGIPNSNGCELDQEPAAPAGTIPFYPLHSHLRTALTLDQFNNHNTLYLTWASHSDGTPYSGFIVGYDATSLQQTTEFAVMPDSTHEGGIWMSGASPAIDPALNKMYVITGNGPNWHNKDSNGNPLPAMGTDSQGNVFSQGTNWPMSVLAFDTTPSGTVSYRNRNEFTVPFSDTTKWFTPAQWDSFNDGDLDLGAGGPLLFDTPAPDGSTKHLLMGGGKAAVMYVLDRTDLGGIDTSQSGTYSRNLPTTYTDDNVVQEITLPPNAGIFNTPAFFNNHVYFSGGSSGVRSRAVGYNQNTNTYISSTEDDSPEGSVDKDAGIFISANGTTGGLVWQAANGVRAWDATNLAKGAIFSQVNVQTDDGSGNACNTATFSLPIVSNGKVYFSCYQKPAQTGTYTVNGSSQPFSQPSDNRPGYLFVYGAAPVPAGAPTQLPMNVAAQADSDSQITVTWSYPTQNGSSNAATGFNVYRATCPACAPTGAPINSSPIEASVYSYADTGVGTYTNANGSTFTMNGLSPNTTYYYTVKATNSAGASNPGSAHATTFPQYGEPGLVAYWPFDEGVLQGANATSSTDFTGHGHTAVKDTSGFNELTSSPSGYVGGSWNYHGTTVIDRLVVQNSSDLQFTAAQSFSLVAWVNPATLHGSTGAGSSDGYDGASIIVKSRDQGNYYGLWINLNGQWEARGPNAKLTGPAATAGTWTQLALVQDGPNNKRYLYVNGVLSATGAAQDASGGGNLWFGQQNLYGSDPTNQTMTDGFGGYIDEVRIYNFVVTPAQLLNQFSDPVFQATSTLTHGSGATATPIALPVYPDGVAGVPATESRVGPNGSYTLTLNFSQPLSATPSATLQAQPTSTQAVQGSVQSVALDSTGMVLTVVLQSVANAQALDLHLTGLTSGAAQNAAYDLPFNIFNGDVSGDHQVNAIDANAISAQIAQNNNNPVTNITASNAMFDLNLDGRIDASDVSLATSLEGTAWKTPVDTELSVFQVSQASSVSTQNPQNVNANAFDNNLGTTWESVRPSNGNANSGVAGVDPGWIYVDLGAPATVDGFTIYWDNAAAAQYTISSCNTLSSVTAGTCADPPSASSGACPADGNWHTLVCETNNAGGSTKTYRGLSPVTARYFKVNGTVRTQAPYAYQLSEFIVYGQPGAAASSPQPNPTLTPPTVNQPMASATQINLTWSASANSTSYSIFRGTSSGGEGAIALGTSQTTSYTDTSSLAGGITYFYTVTASASGYATSGPSNEVQATTPPAPPTLSQPAVSNGSVALSWSAVTNASGYTVYRGTNSGSETVLASTQTNSYTDSANLVGGTTYFYYVLSDGPAGTVSGRSNEVHALTQLGMPTLAQPTVSGSQISLSWSAVVNATSYTIYRGTSSGSETMLASAQTNAYADTNLVSGTTYFYYIMANGNGGSSSGRSNEQSAAYMAPVAPPGSFTLGTPTAGSSSVSLSWSASVGASSYQVLRGLSSGNETSSLTTTNSNSYTDSSVAGGTQYFYKVIASNTGSVTTASNEVSVTTLTATPPAGGSTTGTPIYQINAGSGVASGTFSGDEFFSSSSTSSSSSAIKVAAGDSASQAVYQTNRYGTFSYTFPPLTANATYTLVLHFAETYSGAAAVGKRVFTVTANGSAISCPAANGGSTNCLKNVDIYALAGFDTALVISAPVIADGNGNLKVTFTPSADNAQVNGIELLTNNSSLPLPAAPVNLNAQAGNNLNRLSWNSGAGPTGTYSVYRGTAQGAETTQLPNASNMSLFFIDNTAQNGTTYWYKVVSSNSSGSNFSETSVTTGVPVPGTAIVRMAAGSITSIADPSTGQPFTADPKGKTGASTNANSIKVSGVVQAAPVAVYQNEHSGGSFSYSFNTANGLKPNTATTVRLHFAETYWSAAGQRIFSVSCNSFQLPNFDIFAASGGKNVAIVEQFTTTTDGNGNITLNFIPGSADQPKIDGIELYQ